MSWIQWQGTVLPTTRDEARLTVDLAAEDSRGPSQRWSLSLNHQVPGTAVVSGAHRQVSLGVEIQDLAVQAKHWRDLAGMTVRTTPAFLAQVESGTSFANVVDPALQVHELSASTGEDGGFGCRVWLTVQYEVRLGHWDGTVLPLEIDAWALLPRDDFWRTEPESLEDLASFAQGPPQLRVMTRAIFQGVNVEMERCGSNPEPLARKRACQTLGDLPVKHSSVEWSSIYPHGYHNPPMAEPGWRSVVSLAVG